MTDFTDTTAALEEAGYLAKLYKQTYCVVQADKEVMVVIPKHEALQTYKPILETISHIEVFDIDE